MNHKAYRFQIEPTPEQEILLNKTFGSARFVWNKLVENFNSWTPDIKPEIVTSKTLKDDPEYDFLNEVSAAAIQSKQLHFEEFKKQFFNKKRKVKLGRPRFKSKRNKQSYSLSYQKFKYNSETSSIRLEKIGFVKVISTCLIPEDVDYRSVTVSKTPTGKFYVSILVKEEIKRKPLTGNKIGIDLGLKDLFILSDSQVVENPKFFRENQSKLKKAQQHLSRKVKGSKRREKQRIKVAKIHEDIKNCRDNFLHEMSSAIVRDYDVICIEDLNVSGMVKNHKLAKSISDASWSSFTRMLEYKCDWYGKTLIRIDRFYPSSKTCGCCDYKLDSLELDVREWTCPSCGTIHDRDLNAAKNILRKGYSDLSGVQVEFDAFPNASSVESIEYSRGEAVRLFDARHHLASSVKRLENQLNSL